MKDGMCRTKSQRFCQLVEELTVMLQADAKMLGPNNDDFGFDKEAGIVTVAMLAELTMLIAKAI